MVLNNVDLVFDYSGAYKVESPEAIRNPFTGYMLGDQTLSCAATRLKQHGNC
jgi:hypothetical protein